MQLRESAPHLSVVFEGLQGVGPEGLSVQAVLRSIRQHLGMTVAFVGRFEEGKRHFEYVDSDTTSSVVVGASDPLDASYCQRVVDGRLPHVIHNAGELEEARQLAVTRELPVGAHLSVPIHLPDGSVYGTLCCFDSAPNYTLTGRDAAVMRVVADLLAQEFARTHEQAAKRRAATQRITDLLAGAGYETVFQPIVRLADKQPEGYEALTRFVAIPDRPPDVWFAEAGSVGLRTELELATLRSAIDASAGLEPSVYLSINVSPSTLLDGQFEEVVSRRDRRKLVIEITEHAAIDDYAVMWRALDTLRQQGIRLAIDDMGAGFSSLSHVLRLNPDILKLDSSLVRGVDADPARQAMAAALARFARSTRAQVVAEGVETAREADALVALEIGYGQGYVFGRPTPLTLRAATRSELSRVDPAR